MTEPQMDNIVAWKKTRSGAWSGRGFHYQYLFSTLILIRQWAGLTPIGNLIPEGLEDCVIEFSTQEFWLQIKSRQKGAFSKTEAQTILANVNTKATVIETKIKRNTLVVLEKPPSELKYISVDQLTIGTTEQILVCESPHDDCISILTDCLDSASIIAEGILSDLYKLVASASEENASLSFENRRKISTTEVERRIFERLEAEDPTAINHALASGILEPVNFNDSVSEPTFYQGVKVTPGHITAGLAFDRAEDREKITHILYQHRNVILSGPSGAGKSALLWLSVKNLSSEFRWYQVNAHADASSADAIIRCIRARRPTKSSPIGLAFDEVDSTNVDLWNILTGKLKAIPSVYFLGSIRHEDVALISNQADTEFYEINLDETLAKNVWQKLCTENKTEWNHWREPFEHSEGLMLEYVHILTQGKRLATVIEDQVRQRREEDRHDELAIIRSTAILSTYGGNVNAAKLFELLEIKPENASQALMRLLDEHLVKEIKPGVMGGLHVLRSQSLSRASHDEIVYLSSGSLWRGLLAVTNETLPRVIQSILVETSDIDETTTLHKLADLLSKNQNIDTWVSILTGLGLATLEKNVSIFINISEQHDLQRAQWSLASMFCDPQIDIPELYEFEQWQNLRKAVLAFRKSPKYDLRHMCLEQLPEGIRLPPCENLQQANKLLSCLAPICGGEPMQITISPAFLGNGEHDIRDIAALLSTAYLINPNLAEQLTDELGGEQCLLGCFHSQIPWVTVPIIETDGENGRTVRSNMYYVAEQDQPNPHETICNICETLIAISPRSEAAASNAVTPFGSPISVGDFIPWSKNMPRKNITIKTRVAWNVAFRQILLARSVSDSLTNYTLQMTELVKRTEKIFRSFSEKWIKGKPITNTDTLADEINNIIKAVNALAYTAPRKYLYEMTTPNTEVAQDDQLGTLLTGILGNLLGRIIKTPDVERPKGVAMFSANLAIQARENEQSDIWRACTKPPLQELKALAARLTDLSYILHELAFDDSQSSIQRLIKSTKKSSLGKAISTAARMCHLNANRRFGKKIKVFEETLKAKGLNTQCWLRPLNETDNVYWPATEIAITLHIQDFEKDAPNINEAISLAQAHLGNDWRFRVAPVINNLVVSQLAILPSSHGILSDQNFAKDWKNYIDISFLSSSLIDEFDKALGACIQLSAVIACRDLDKLHPEEDKIITKTIEAFEQSRDFIFDAAKNSNTEYILLACDYLNEIWKQVVSEFGTVKTGQTVEEPLCMNHHLSLAGQENDKSTEIAGVRIFILQNECIHAE